MLGTLAHLFVKVPRPGENDVILSVFGVKLPPVTSIQSNQSKVKAILFSALPKDTTNELSGLSPH